jgi:hypothetical protein
MNRISASRLQQTSRVLGVPIDYFYEGAPQFGGETVGGFAESPPPAYMAELTTNDGLNLLKAFASIRSRASAAASSIWSARSPRTTPPKGSARGKLRAMRTRAASRFA